MRLPSPNKVLALIVVFGVTGEVFVLTRHGQHHAGTHPLLHDRLPRGIHLRAAAGGTVVGGHADNDAGPDALTSNDQLNNDVPPEPVARDASRVTRPFYDAGLRPALRPPPEAFLPPGEPVLDGAGEYIPRAHRQDPRSLGEGVEGRGVYEERQQPYLPFPQLVPLPELLKRWPPDEPDIPDIPGLKDGSLEVLDYSNITERARADWLRWNEVPFKLINVPAIDETARKWSSDQYMLDRFGDELQKVTTSKSNHFRFYRLRGAHGRSARSPGFTPPTGDQMMTFGQWLDKAKAAENQDVESDHYYLQLNSVGRKRWILDDLTVFRPQKSFFVADPRGNRGSNCRFGARGITASNHWDGGRNFVTILRGAKRYILLPPSQCPSVYLYPNDHPERRHSSNDWSQLNLTTHPLMAQAMATEVVLTAGEALYIPSYWFHYIISTGVSFQCNTRSGNGFRGRDDLYKCGEVPNPLANIKR